jgi:hypothetical protein
MGYVIAAILVLLIVGGFVFFLVANATNKSNVSDAGDPGADQNALSIIGSEGDSPLGDTTEHAGEQNESGETIGQQDADVHGGSGAPPSAQERHTDRPDVARPVVGGEAEGERSSR